jgi:hypothetical protein
MSARGHLRPSCTITAEGNSSPDSFRAGQVGATEVVGQKQTSASAWLVQVVLTHPEEALASVRRSGLMLFDPIGGGRALPSLADEDNFAGGSGFKDLFVCARCLGKWQFPSHDRP